MYKPQPKDVILKQKTLAGIKCAELIVKQNGSVYIAFDIPVGRAAQIIRQRLEKQQNVPVQRR